MTETTNDTSLSSNPFQSPELPSGDSQPIRSTPSIAMLLVCLVIGNVVNFASSFSFYTSPDFPLMARLTWLPVDLLFGLTYSLGLAILAHAVYCRIISALMPGHWRLIAFLFNWLIYLNPIFEPTLGFAFFLVILYRTNETRVWKSYAWQVLLLSLAVVIRDGLFQLSPNYIESMTETFNAGDSSLASTTRFGMYVAASYVTYLLNITIFLTLVLG
ncbi:hypothetical protein [Bremerella sp.]|uniref:hypothetical protein n=1 Tax=Bremerella sp. TaxID=2795602 RepID=UPI00391D947A